MRENERKREIEREERSDSKKEKRHTGGEFSASSCDSRFGPSLR
jgi:hypothetical protein